MPMIPGGLRSRATGTLIHAHRYLGIALGLMLVVWFASGIVMMYVGGMPRLGEELRLRRLPVLDLSRVALTPGEAAQRLGADADAQATLLTLMGRPAYRFSDGGILFADDGSPLGGIDVNLARRIASRFAGVPPTEVHYVRTLAQPDQWTLGQNRQMPLHKFTVDEDSGSELYVSAATAEVVMLTTSRTRSLAWIGAIPHWMYLVALRNDQSLWYRTVVWLSAASCVLVILGLALAFTQYRRTRPFNWSLAIPYRRWMRWHYVCGALFGLPALTWAFSGMLSMQPFAWMNEGALHIPRQVFSGGPADLAQFNAVDAAALKRATGTAELKQVDFMRIHDEHYYSLRAVSPGREARSLRERLRQGYLISGRREEAQTVLVNAATDVPVATPFSSAAIIMRLGNAVPACPIVEYTLLEDYDSYYYSRDRQRALPVLRVKFGDPAQTWVYVDPRTSRLVMQLDRFSRLERWLYNGLHSLDFKFWYDQRPWWDIGLIVLLLGGMATSGLGTWLGIKRLAKGLLPRRTD